jgi:hypothetical protein
VLRDAEVLQSNDAGNFKGPYTSSSADIYKVEKAEKGLVYQGKTSYRIPSLIIVFGLATTSSFLKEPFVMPTNLQTIQSLSSSAPLKRCFCHI